MTPKEQLILKYQDAYYNEQPIVSDEIYDALFEDVKKENPDSPVLKRVGASPSGDWPKENHSIEMLSLDKANKFEEVQKWWPGYQAVIMDKLDGFSVAIKFSKGKFVKAITHGDGTVGDDITRNVSIMQGVPKNIEIMDDIWIRGEIICLKDIFERCYKPLGYKNARNTASSISRKKDNYIECENLTLVTYLIQGFKTKEQELLTLKKLGFNIPNYDIVTLDQVENVYNDYVQHKRKTLNYDIDGLVICVNNNDIFEDMGRTEHHPKGAIAFKFPHESKTTILRNVRWQIGNTGRLTPVAEFDPVELAGVTVKNASLHTAGRIKTLQLYKNCEILVSRRNDCIPFVEANISLGIIVED